MKQEIIFEILNKLKAKPNLLRKLKIFATVGVIGVVVMGGLIVWAGIAAINTVASSANQVIQSTVVQGHVDTLKAELNVLPKVHAINCWDKAQSLLAITPWLERPALDNLASLKAVCLDHKANSCQGPDCEHLKELIKTVEGSFI
jgi:hypothetical protein